MSLPARDTEVDEPAIEALAQIREIAGAALESHARRSNGRRGARARPYDVRRPDCVLCQGSGMVEDERGFAHRCDHGRPPTPSPDQPRHWADR